MGLPQFARFWHQAVLDAREAVDARWYGRGTGVRGEKRSRRRWPPASSLPLPEVAPRALTSFLRPPADPAAEFVGVQTLAASWSSVLRLSASTCRPDRASQAHEPSFGLFSLARRMGTSVDQIDKTYGHLLPDAVEFERGLLDAFDSRADGQSFMNG